jgi:hypothetical protein
MALDSTQEMRVREFSTTNVTYRTGQYFCSARAGAPVASSRTDPWMMKTLFDLAQNGTAQGPLLSQALAGKQTARRPLSPIASTFQPQIPSHQGVREEFGKGRSALRTTSVPSSATEPDQLESFQPSMLCNHSLPIYFLTTERFPQLHSNKCED